MKPEASIESYTEAEKLEIVYGQITAVEDIPKSEKMIKLTVDFGGTYGVKTILSGIKNEFVDIQALKGMSSFFVLNFAPRKMLGHISEGMIVPFNRSGQMVIGGPTFGELPIGTKLF